MQRGFFPASSLVSYAPHKSKISRCGSCGLSKGCLSPKMLVTGKGRLGVLVVAEAPGALEDERGIQLIGKAGKRLRATLDDLGCDLDDDCWKTNAVICRPPDNKTPTDAQIEACRPSLLKTIQELEPSVIILLGSTALKSLIGFLWRDSPGAIGRWVGWQIPSQGLNAWICPTWHPSYLLRKNQPVLDLLFKQHLEGALGLVGTVPWPDGVPDWESEVRIIQDVDKAAAMVNFFQFRSNPVSFDYETDRLKPDHKDARIVSCSVSDGEMTIAFPWVGKAIEAISNLLRSGVPKIGANNKFEERWTRDIMGHGVRNWMFDTMIAAHVLDNRQGITGLKFQSFVRLGIGSYDSVVAPYLKAKGGNEPNRIREVGMRELLLYNGLDSLLAWHLAQKQMEDIKCS